MVIVSGMCTRRTDTGSTRKSCNASHRDQNFPGKRAAALSKRVAQNTDRIVTALNRLTVTDIESIAALRFSDLRPSFELVLHVQLCFLAHACMVVS